MMKWKQNFAFIYSSTISFGQRLEPYGELWTYKSKTVMLFIIKWGIVIRSIQGGEYTMKKNIIMIILFILNAALFAVDVLLPDGSIYHGNLKDDLFSGKAVQIWSNGDKYEGEYQNGLFHGYGEMTTNSYIYKGDYFNGLQTGKAFILYSDGSSYEGEVNAGLYEGDGILKTSVGNIFEGVFKNGFLNGKGKIIYNDGAVCSGNFINTKLEGQGVYKYSNGDSYIGNFVNGKFDGFGTLTKQNGKIYQGKFSNGELPYKYIWKTKMSSVLLDITTILLLISFILNIVFIIKIKKRSK